MNLDIREKDFIVVGSGPGGATIAKELSQRNKKVLILEWGDNAPLTGSFRQGAKTLLFPGKSMLFTPQMVGPMSKRLMESAQALGYNWKKLDKFMYQDKWKPEYEFGHYGDPHQVKWSARMYIEEALENGANIINNAKVKTVLFEGNKAVGVEFTKGQKGYKAFASKTIISAGGIGTPIILRKSGIKKAGYDFFFDPLIGVRGTVKDIEVPTSEIPMTAGVHMEDEGYMMTDMAHPFATTAMFAAGVFKFQKMFSRPKTLQIMVKAKDELGGKLTDSGGVRKILDKNEKQKLWKGYERAKEILKNAGAKDIFKTQYLAAHPGGTVKIGDLVDSNLKTEYDNLYVCDCSVIPEAWGVPPTTTLIGLGKRLSKHLLKYGQKSKINNPLNKQIARPIEPFTSKLF